MFFIVFLFVFWYAIVSNQDGLFTASALFAIASTIEWFTYKYFKNK